MEAEWRIIGRGFCGWHAQGVNVSSSGGRLEPYKYFERDCPGYLANAIEGALVYDASECEKDEQARNAFITLVIRGPIVSPELAPEEEQRFMDEDREAAKRMSPGLQGTFAALAKAAQDKGYTGLNRVGVALYEALLRTVPLVKIGHVRNGQIVWD